MFGINHGFLFSRFPKATLAFTGVFLLFEGGNFSLSEGHTFLHERLFISFSFSQRKTIRFISACSHGDFMSPEEIQLWNFFVNPTLDV